MKLEATMIEQLERELVETIKSSNTTQLETILHDELLFIAPNGTVVTKAMDIASHKSGEMIVHQLALKIEEIRIMDDSAVAVVVYETNGVMLGQPIEGRFRYIRFWKSFSEGPKVIGGSCTKL